MQISIYPRKPLLPLAPLCDGYCGNGVVTETYHKLGVGKSYPYANNKFQQALDEKPHEAAGHRERTVIIKTLPCKRDRLPEGVAIGHALFAGLLVPILPPGAHRLRAVPASCAVQRLKR